MSKVGLKWNCEDKNVYVYNGRAKRTVWESCGGSFPCFSSLFEDFIYSRIKGWRLNRRLAQPLLPAVRAVYEGFQGSRLWRLLGGLLEQMAS